MTPRPDTELAAAVAINIREQLLAMYAAGDCVCDVDVARLPLKLGRVAAYKLAAQGALTDGVPVLRVGRKYKVPLAPLLRAVGMGIGDVDLSEREEA